jgi:hypothetical protein
MRLTGRANSTGATWGAGATLFSGVNQGVGDYAKYKKV